MEVARRWQALAAAGAASLGLAGAGLFAAGAPASRAVAAATTHSCGNHAVTIELPGEAGQPPRQLKTQTKNVKATGLSCQAAFKFLNAIYKSNLHTPPEHFKCKNGKFKEPAGYVPTVCTHAAKKIEYGAQGG